MSAKLFRYFLGLGLLLAIIAVLTLRPITILIYQQLPHLELLKRAIGIILLCAFFCLFRILRGPHSADRIMALDMLGILVMGVCALLSISTQRSWYMDIGIAWGLQSFVTTLAFSKFLEGKDFDE